MNKSKKTRLHVSRETIAQLNASRLQAVNGGNIWSFWVATLCGPKTLDGKTDG